MQICVVCRCGAHDHSEWDGASGHGSERVLGPLLPGIPEQPQTKDHALRAEESEPHVEHTPRYHHFQLQQR